MGRRRIPEEMVSAAAVRIRPRLKGGVGSDEGAEGKEGGCGDELHDECGEADLLLSLLVDLEPLVDMTLVGMREGFILFGHS